MLEQGPAKKQKGEDNKVIPVTHDDAFAEPSAAIITNEGVNFIKQTTAQQRTILIALLKASPVITNKMAELSQAIVEGVPEKEKAITQQLEAEIEKFLKSIGKSGMNDLRTLMPEVNISKTEKVTGFFKLIAVSLERQVSQKIVAHSTKELKAAPKHLCQRLPDILDKMNGITPTVIELIEAIHNEKAVDELEKTTLYKIQLQSMLAFVGAEHIEEVAGLIQTKVSPEVIQKLKVQALEKPAGAALLSAYENNRKRKEPAPIALPALEPAPAVLPKLELAPADSVDAIKVEENVEAHKGKRKREAM